MGIFFSSLIIGYSGAIMPGSMLTYTLSKSLKGGGKSGLLIAFGHALLEFILVIILLTGLGKYLNTTPAKLIISIAGGTVLFFFGITMLKDVYLKKLNINFFEENSSNKSLIWGGAVISLSNPYFIFWWVVVGLGLIMSAYNTLGIWGVALFYFGHILSDFTWFGFVSVIFSKTKNFINLKLYSLIVGILALCLIGFGITFFTYAVKLI